MTRGTISPFRPRLRTLARLAGVVVAAIAITSLPARADVVVLAAKGGTLKSGATLKAADAIELPAGATAEVLLPSGTMRTLKGPLKTTVGELTRGEKPEAGILDKVTGILQKSGSEATTGATRSVAAAIPRMSLPFSWTEIPIDASGDYCVERGVPLALKRAASDKALRVTVVELASNSRGEVAFAEKAQLAPWPATLEAKTAKYAIVAPERGMRQVQLRLISPLPPRESVIRVLHGQGCEVQMQAFLRDLMR